MTRQTTDAFGRALSPADQRLFDLRASGYTGPVDQDGRAVPPDDLGARILARLREVPEPPDRPRGMSVERYREEWDSCPCVVVDRTGAETRFGGAVRAWLYARGQQGARVVR